MYLTDIKKINEELKQQEEIALKAKSKIKELKFKKERLSLPFGWEKEFKHFVCYDNYTEKYSILEDNNVLFRPGYCFSSKKEAALRVKGLNDLNKLIKIINDENKKSEYSEDKFIVSIDNDTQEPCTGRVFNSHYIEVLVIYSKKAADNVLKKIDKNLLISAFKYGLC